MIEKGMVKAAGRVYPEGTIAGDGFDPKSAETIGRWLCRGWFLLSEDRPERHVVTTQEYIFEEIKPDWLYPPDQLASSEKVPEIPTRRPHPLGHRRKGQVPRCERRGPPAWTRHQHHDSGYPGSARTQLSLCVQAQLTTPVTEEVN